ncbi:MAG: hypothetical protein R3B95_21465, partial [Nitrospirales bacterium]|nr:hypothetical protein [Nitrospirales bacterium]
VTPSPATLEGTNAGRRADQLAALRQGPPNRMNLHLRGQAAGMEHMKSPEAILDFLFQFS